MNNFNQFQPQRPQYSSYFNPATGATASTNNIFWVNGIEGAKAWQKHIELAAIDFNIEDIIQEQEDYKKKYKKKLKEINYD